MSQGRFSRLQGHLRQGWLGAGLLLLGGAAMAADALPQPDASRGELLYATHCFSCHNVDVHWRGKRLVTDLSSLNREVQRWQETSGLGWSEGDVAEVTLYLNSLHYSYPVSK